MDNEFLYEKFKSDPIYNLELFEFIFGECIGNGASRAVYVFNPNPKYVIKVQVDNMPGYNKNLREYELWNRMNWDEEMEDIKKWFAPVKLLSRHNRLLLQPRCEPLPKARIPKKVPHFFRDLKSDNWGLLNNKVVCFDYGTVDFDDYISKKAYKLKSRKFNI